MSGYRGSAVRGIALVMAIFGAFGLAAGEAQSQSLELRRDPAEFAVPRALPPRLAVTFAGLSGRTIQFEDSYGVATIDLMPDGMFVFNDDAGNDGIRGFWWVNPLQNLCVTSQVYWWKGECFAVHGKSLSEMHGIMPLMGQRAYYPAQLVR